MIVYVINKGHEYGLVLSTIHKYIYNIGDYTKVAMIYQLSTSCTNLKKMYY